MAIESVNVIFGGRDRSDVEGILRSAGISPHPIANPNETYPNISIIFYRGQGYSGIEGAALIAQKHEANPPSSTHP